MKIFDNDKLMYVIPSTIGLGAPLLGKKKTCTVHKYSGLKEGRHSNCKTLTVTMLMDQVRISINHVSSVMLRSLHLLQ
jgi:hypothetical protein